MPQDLGLAVSAAAVCLDTDPRGLGGASGTALAFDAMSGAARVVIEASSIGSSTPGGSASRGELQAHAAPKRVAGQPAGEGGARIVLWRVCRLSHKP